MAICTRWRDLYRKCRRAGIPSSAIASVGVYAARKRVCSEEVTALLEDAEGNSDVLEAEGIACKR